MGMIFEIQSIYVYCNPDSSYVIQYGEQLDQ